MASVFEHGVSTSVGDVTISPSNQNIVWIGLGEGNIFRSSMAGAGVYKSTDAGETWQHMGLATVTFTIPRIVVHPTNPDIVYVADSGHEWTDNPERGLYKTVDGGKTWERVFYVDEKTGVIDLAMDPETRRQSTPRPGNEFENAGTIRVMNRITREVEFRNPLMAARPGKPSARGCQKQNSGAGSESIFA